jgi:threonyl-tRNA synthetase
MKVLLPDNSELELPDGATGLDAARAIGPKLAEQAVLVRSNGHVHDLRLPLADGEQIQILTTRDKDDPDALSVLRHSSAHLLAEAVRRLYPGVKIAIGPPIDNGFYYDFDFPEPIHEADLERIEDEIRRELKEGRAWSRAEMPREEARKRFQAEGEPYKVELVDTAEGDISLYSQFSKAGGEFTDLCRGPHLQDSKPIKALKLTGLAGAYWRGDSSKPQLTRIYGTAFYSQEQLDEYLHRLEEAKRRDHRRLGIQLDLFHFDELSPGSPFWHPKGMTVWNILEDLRRSENAKRGYVEVKTPLIYERDLWVTSGHWDKFRENMFFLAGEPGDERLFGLKPMNCPGHCLVYASRARSYKELPLRLAEAGTLHRNEPSGSLHGLLRVRHVTQDDGHIFCDPGQIEQEVFNCLDHAFYLYDLLELKMRIDLSLRPDNRLGADEDWDLTEAALRSALVKRGLSFYEMPGEGAFYGPKIDMHMEDSLGRSWQLGTVQLDFQMPHRFELEYATAWNRPDAPAMIHRALFGSMERFIGILIEHYAGAFPFWLAPVQVRVIPVGEDHREAARALQAKIPYRVEVDDSDETVGKRIRNAEVEKIPYVVVYGDKESEGSLAIRERGGEQSTRSLADFLTDLGRL